jgi:hypothetical protein
MGKRKKNAVLSIFFKNNKKTDCLFLSCGQKNSLRWVNFHEMKKKPKNIKKSKNYFFKRKK